MKKLFTLALVGLTLSLVGCSLDTQNTNQIPDQAQSTNRQDSPTPGQGQGANAAVVENNVSGSLRFNDPKCNSIADEQEREYCYADKAGNEQNIAMCDALKLKDPKEYCYGGIRDHAACQKVSSPFGRSLCYTTIVDYKAVEKSLTDSDCKRIDIVSVKDRCYNGLAVQEKQFGVCNLISKDGEEGDTISKCTFNVAVARDGCKDLSMPTRDLCYSAVALMKRDRGACAQVQSQEMRSTCERSISAP